MGLTWFKHYNTAHEGKTICELWASHDSELIAFYWTILEMVSRWEDENERGVLVVKLSTLKMKLGMNSQRSSKLLAKISSTFKIEVKEISEETYKLSVPNWLELQETRGGKNKANFVQSAGRSKKEEVRSKKEELKHTKKVKPVAAAPSFDFEKLYLEYPPRGDPPGIQNSYKSSGIKKLNSIVKTSEQFTEVEMAVKNYRAHCEEKKICGTEFVKSFSSFFFKNYWKNHLVFVSGTNKKSKEVSFENLRREINEGRK